MSKLTNQAKGELRKKRLAEVAQSGELQTAKTRNDVARLCGFGTDQSRAVGYNWASSMIKGGLLRETLVRKVSPRKAEYEYTYLGNLPVKKTKTITVSDTAPQFEVVEKPVENSAVITIYHGETTLAIEGVGGDTVVEIVKSIIK